MPQKYNWIRDKIDTRDHKYALKATNENRIVDLRNYCSPVEQQGNISSCTGQAIAGIIEYLARKSKKNIDVSRLFIYYQERLLEGTVNYDSGAYIRDGIKVVNKYGVPLESYWPYIESKYNVRPTAFAYSDALTRKAIAYQRCVDFDSVKNALNNGNPVVVGFDVYKSFEGDRIASTGVMNYPDIKKEEYLGGHAVLLVGYNDNIKRFIARNSWGQYWGDKGYFYMPYEVIQNTSMSSDFWIITSITNP